MKVFPKHLEFFYNAVADIPQQGDATEVQRFADLAGCRPKRILDLGCAEGKLALELARRGHEVTAADISDAQLQHVKHAAQGEGLEIRTQKLDIESETPASFDIVFLMDIIEHLKNPVDALLRIRSLDCRLFIHTPNANSLYRFLRYLLFPQRRYDFRRPGVLLDFHFFLYDYLTLNQTLAMVGYKIEGIHSTKMHIPLFGHRRLPARIFPHLADTLLFECRPCEPIDMESAIAHWRE